MKRSASTLLGLLLFCGIAHAQPQPTLSLDFEDGVNATLPGGKSLAPRVEGKVELQNGKFGKAFKSGPDSGYLHFPAEGIVSPKSGTVEMWVCPLDWDGSEQQFHVFFDARGQGALYLYKFYQGGLLMLSTPGGSTLQSAAAPMKDWKPGEWHHIAGTWSPTHQAVYVDGKLMGTIAPALPKSLDTFVLGDNPWHEPLGPRTSSSLIDLVRIYDRSLAPEHIAAHFAGDYNKVVPLTEKNLGFRFSIDRAAKTLSAVVDNNGADVGSDETRIEFSLLQNGAAIQKSESLSFADSSASAQFALAALQPGAYQLVAVARQGGKEIVRLAKPLIIPDIAAWKDNRIGEQAGVLPPWTPLQVRRGDKSTFSVACWGREYQFGASPFPTQIIAKNETLLAAPIALKVLAGGKEISWQNGGAKITAQSPAAVEVEGRAQSASGVLLTTKMRLEYDGLMMLDFDLKAPPDFKAEAVSLEIPVRETSALYQHRWTPSWAGKTGALPAATGVVDSDNFIPYYWLGDNERGLFWFCESARHWPNFQDKNAVQVVREPINKTGAVTMRFHLLEGQAVPQNWKFTFGLQATPVKPIPRDWRKRRLLPATRGNVSIIWPTPEKNSMTYYGYPEATDPALFAARIKDLHDKGIAAVPYSALSYFSEAAPEWPWFKPEWSSGSGDAGSSDVAQYGAVFARIVPTSKTYSDFIIWKNQQFMQQFKLDGYYHDNSHPYPCDSGQDGCGWKDASGATQPVYPFMAYRDLYRRLYAMAKKEKPDAFLMAHMSGKIGIPFLAYEDSYLDGENFRGVVKDSYMDVVGLDYWRTELMGKQWGLMPFFLPEFDAEHSAQIEPTRGLAALVMLHDVSVWPIWSNITVWNEMYDALDKFGYVDSEFIPYFDPTPPATTDMKDVYISVYKRANGHALAIVGNTSREDRSGTVTLNAKRIGLATSGVLSWPDKAALAQDGTKIKLDVPRLGYRMLLIGKAPEEK
jgi:hypothetical protein